jgi:peptide/nickel transport system ATP-binding protein
LDLFASIADMAFAVPDRADPTNCVSKTDADVLMRVTGLTVRIRVPGGALRAVDGVSFVLGRGETLGLVGESGSGKTITALALMRLLETPPAEVVAGSVSFAGRDLLALSEHAMADVRGRSLSMIFQEPMTSLNPLMTIGRQIAEPLGRHLRISNADAARRARELLTSVGIPDATRVAAGYAHELSGGMRQRVTIAIAIACRPAILIADEPTTALDVTIQAQILELLTALQNEMGMAMLLITHDLAVVAETAHRVAVMYAGRIVETAPVAHLFAEPRHPYTRGLLRSVPRIERLRPPTLPEIPGVVPSLDALPQGCAFAPRCPLSDATCRAKRPELVPVTPGHDAACWKSLDG